MKHGQVHACIHPVHPQTPLMLETFQLCSCKQGGAYSVFLLQQTTKQTINTKLLIDSGLRQFLLDDWENSGHGTHTPNSTQLCNKAIKHLAIHKPHTLLLVLYSTTQHTKLVHLHTKMCFGCRSIRAAAKHTGHTAERSCVEAQIAFSTMLLDCTTGEETPMDVQPRP